jgi:hypothetical protein
MNQKRPATSEWVGKMLAVLKTGNTTAAMAQIKATTSSKDLRQLHAALEKAQLLKQLKRRRQRDFRPVAGAGLAAA